MNLELTHPYYFILNYLLNKSDMRKSKYIFTFSKYVYIPNQVNDDREIFHITEEEFRQKEPIENLINSLNSEQELAFHSEVKIISLNGKVDYKHIPMIDFYINPIDFTYDFHYWRLNNLMTSKTKNPILFETGRSLHGYGDKLLSLAEWHEFMGRLLLVDQINRESPIIDTRWVGHRIIGGYSALRWSNNSGKYLSQPKRFI